jgi:dihydropteroate synthase
LEEEFSRVLPVIEAVTKQVSIPVSIDTYKAAVAERAVAAGAQIINDISALRADPEMAATAARAATGLVLMHIQGTPRDMQQNPHYDDLMDEICSYLRESLAIARRGGVSLEKTIIDPGIGFGKTVWHNLEVLDRLGELRSIGRPILIGTSRKSTIGKVTGAPVGERQFGTAATVAVSIRNGAHIVRVHDVGQMRQVAKMTDAIGRWQQAVPAGEMR